MRSTLDLWAGEKGYQKLVPNLAGPWIDGSSQRCLPIKSYNSHVRSVRRMWKKNLMQGRVMATANAEPALESFFAQSSALHKHLCPRQVLGVRMGMHAAGLFTLKLPQSNKRLLTFVETDGCFSDGISVATGCTMGHRTMRLVDHGKIAATFVDTHTAKALRCSASPDARVMLPPVCPTPGAAGTPNSPPTSACPTKSYSRCRKSLCLST